MVDYYSVDPFRFLLLSFLFWFSYQCFFIPAIQYITTISQYTYIIYKFIYVLIHQYLQYLVTTMKSPLALFWIGIWFSYLCLEVSIINSVSTMVRMPFPQNWMMENVQENPTLDEKQRVPLDVHTNQSIDNNFPTDKSQNHPNIFFIIIPISSQYDPFFRPQSHVLSTWSQPQ